MATVKQEYKINKKTEIFIRLLYSKGYIVSEMLNGDFKNKSYNKKPIKNEDKVIRILLLKKPKDVRLYLTKSIYTFHNMYNINLKINDNNELNITNSFSVLKKELEEIYREAEFFENIQFW